MKHRFILWLLAWLLALPLCAQTGLHIASVFNGQYRQRKDATEVLLKGKKISQYKLSLFRSLTLPPSNAERDRIERLVQADARQAIDKEVSLRGGHLYYGFYQLKPQGRTRRYIFYRNNALHPSKAGDNKTLTIIYMEGTATIEELQKIFL